LGQFQKHLLAGLIALATGLLPHLAAAAGLIRDAEIERTLKAMSTPIFEAAGYPPENIDIYIINDNSLNAFVANGNNMFLHTGLLQTLETPEELLAVIAHETGHLAGGHQARRQINIRNTRGPALLGLLVGLAAGAAGGGGAAGTAVIAGSQSAIQRTLLRYNRGEEAAADQAALQYLSRAHVDPAGLLKVFGRFRGQEVFNIGNVDPFILTHPLSTERLQLIERRVAEAAERHFPEEPDRAYWHARMRAKLIGYLDGPERVLDRLEGEPETEEVLYTDPFYIELKGQILFETGRSEEAAPLYREAVRLAPGEPLLGAGLGRALLSLNQPETDAEALEVLQNARRRDLADATALRDLATAYSRAGDRGMAELATAERYALTGRIEDAMRHARRAVATIPEGSPGWLRAQDILSLKPE
jgi:predicted Zn-dependent protease